MKFTKKSLIETLRDLNDGKTSYQARKNAKVSIRRIYQIQKEYLTTGNIPEIGKGVGRPMIPIKQEEVDLIKMGQSKKSALGNNYLIAHHV